MRQFAVSEIPILMLARMLVGVAQFVFPIHFGQRNAVLLEQGVLLALEVRPGGQVGANLARQRRRNVDFLLGVEKRRELVKLFLADGVELVIVALSAPNRQPQPDGSERGRAVEHLLVAELLGVRSAFAVGQSVAIESGRDQGFVGAIRHLVARQLLDGKFVERHVAV